LDERRHRYRDAVGLGCVRVVVVVDSGHAAS
jgi:hypothetical protein